MGFIAGHVYVMTLAKQFLGRRTISNYPSCGFSPQLGGANLSVDRAHYCWTSAAVFLVRVF